jgi:hypothetical protein
VEHLEQQRRYAPTIIGDVAMNSPSDDSRVK